MRGWLWLIGFVLADVCCVFVVPPSDKGACPSAFDAFWAQAKKRVHEFPLNVTCECDAASPYTLVTVYDVTIRGLDGTPVKGWLVTPAYAKGIRELQDFRTTGACEQNDRS